MLHVGDALLKSQILHCPTTTILRPLYNWRTQSGTGGFCCSKVLPRARPNWQELAHSDEGEDARVLLNSVTYIISVSCEFYPVTDHYYLFSM